MMITAGGLRKFQACLLDKTRLTALEYQTQCFGNKVLGHFSRSGFQRLLNMMFVTPGNHWVLWLVFVFYAISLLFAVWRLALGKPYFRGTKIGLLLPGFLLHTFYLWERGLVQGRCPVSNPFETLVFIAWCLVALHLIIILFGRINYLTVFYMPLVLIVQLAALVIPMDRPLFMQWKGMSWLGLHASVIMLGYAAFGLAGAVALMYLIQERQLRTRRLSSRFMLLPPILRLESAQSWLVIAGFCFLTLGLLSGIAVLKVLHLTFAHGDAKFLWSAAVWLMYLVLLIGRFVVGMNGRWMAWLSMAGCVFVLSTFWLANIWSQFHHY